MVTEINPIKAIEAHMDGFTVLPMKEAAKVGELFVTLTGNKDVLSGEHFDSMKDGAILCNAGHFDVEISKPDLEGRAASIREVRTHIDEYEMQDGRKLYLLAGGRLVNLAAGDGHPAEVMDLTFALQALALRHVVDHGGELSKDIHPVPEELDRYVAHLRLSTMGIEIDTLTASQEAYIAGWKE